MRHRKNGSIFRKKACPGLIRLETISSLDGDNAKNDRAGESGTGLAERCQPKGPVENIFYCVANSVTYFSLTVPMERLCRIKLEPARAKPHAKGFNMDATALGALQAPLKELYKGDPKSATITLKARGSLDDTAIACKVETGRALAVAGLHPATGGSGLALCSGDMLLGARVACAGVTWKAVAPAIEIPLKSGIVSAEGDLDFRGTLGGAKDAPVGFKQIRVRFEVDTDVPQDKLDQLLKLTERYCVVYQTLKSGPPIEVGLQRV